MVRSRNLESNADMLVRCGIRQVDAAPGHGKDQIAVFGQTFKHDRFIACGAGGFFRFSYQSRLERRASSFSL